MLLAAGLLIALQAPVITSAVEEDPPADPPPVGGDDLATDQDGGRSLRRRISRPSLRVMVASRVGDRAAPPPRRRRRRAALADAQQRYASDPQVQRVEVEKTREAQAVPSDTDYGEQWALPQIGWDQAFGPSTQRLRDDRRARHRRRRQPADLAGHLVPGFGAFPDPHRRRPERPRHRDGEHRRGRHRQRQRDRRRRVRRRSGDAGAGARRGRPRPGQRHHRRRRRGCRPRRRRHPHGVLATRASATRCRTPSTTRGRRAPCSSPPPATTARRRRPIPAGAAKVVGVSATDSQDALWAGSNYGADMFLAAPGVDVSPALRPAAPRRSPVPRPRLRSSPAPPRY